MLKPLPPRLECILEKNTKILEGKPLERLGWKKEKEDICVPKPSRVLCMLNNERDSMSNMNDIDLAGLAKKKKNHKTRLINTTRNESEYIKTNGTKIKGIQRE